MRREEEQAAARAEQAKTIHDTLKEKTIATQLEIDEVENETVSCHVHDMPWSHVCQSLPTACQQGTPCMSYAAHSQLKLKKQLKEAQEERDKLRAQLPGTEAASTQSVSHLRVSIPALLTGG